MADTRIQITGQRSGGSGYTGKFTWSGWVKRASSDIGTYSGLFSFSRNDGWVNSRCKLHFRDSDRLGWELKDSSGNDDNSFETNMKFKDPHGWYHICFSYDSSQSTEADRLKLWVNGVDIRNNGGGFSSINEAGSSFQSLQSSDTTCYIGAFPNNSGVFHYFDGLMADVYYTVEYCYDASHFGETDATTGEWKPKTNVTVTYGEGGYNLKFQDDTNMDLDSGTNNYTFTTNGTGVTQTKDCPSNVFCTMNDLEEGQDSTFTMGATKIEWNTNNKTNFASMAVNKGKWYWEMKYANVSGGTDAMTGVCAEIARDPSDWVGHDGNGWSYYASNGNYYHNGGSVGSYGNSWGVNNIIGVAFDADTRTLWFSKDGVWQNSATISEIAAGTTTNAMVTGFGSAGDWFIPATSGYDGNKIEFNFGNGYFSTTKISSAGSNASGIGAFEYDVPNNFTALSTKGLNE